MRFPRPRPLYLFLLALVLPLQAFAKREGGDWSSTGGGGGVACFAEAALAEEAKPFILAGKTIPAGLLAQAKLQTLEHWEMPHTKTIPWAHPAGANWQEIHRTVRGLIRQVAPLFADRLEIAGGWSEYGQWEQQTELSFLEDATPVADLPAECVRIQLALRYSNGNQTGPVNSPTKNAVQVKVVFNKIYFDLLPPLDQAMLVLHEELYVMGQAIGHPSSDIIRSFIRVFFSEPFVKSHQAMAHQPHHMNPGDLSLRVYLIKYFGDYVEFFTLTNKEVDAAPFTSRHHFQTFLAFIRRKRGAVVKCRDEGGGHMACTDKIINPGLMAKELNPEEAFIYLANFYLEQGVGLLNYDYIMRPQPDDAHYVAAMHFACNRIDLLEPTPAIKRLKDNALTYCKAWQAHQSKLARENPGK